MQPLVVGYLWKCSQVFVLPRSSLVLCCDSVICNLLPSNLLSIVLVHFVNHIYTVESEALVIKHAQVETYINFK